MGEETWGQVFAPGSITVAGVVLLIGVSIMRGWLVPRRTLEDVRKDRDDRLAEKDREIERAYAERDQWRQTALAAEEGRAVSSEQVATMLEGMKTVTAVVTALPRVGEDGEDHGRGS